MLLFRRPGVGAGAICTCTLNGGAFAPSKVVTVTAGPGGLAGRADDATQGVDVVSAWRSRFAIRVVNAPVPQV